MGLIIDDGIREVIEIFMYEASKKTHLKKGLSNHRYPDIHDKAIGLVEIMVPFEAIITALQPFEPNIWKKRNYFSSKYQGLFNQSKDSCKSWIDELYEELKNEQLIDMTPPPKHRPPINVTDKDNLSEIIEIIYRVRSNMIHGNKTLNSERNKILITNSFYIMHNFLNILLKEERIIRSNSM